MKFNEVWLRSFVDPDVDTQGLVDQLTMAGLEVDGTEPVAAIFSGIIVGEILGVEAHPNADKLVVCRVSDGESEHQVVCGAPNARAGIKVPFATVGAELEDAESDSGKFKIRKAKLRGVESFGMLCSERELGISENHDGLMELPLDAPVGQDVRDYLLLNDATFDLDLTPNRSDCLGLFGLARETGLINSLEVKYPQIDPVAATIDDVFPVALAAPEHCPRFVGRVIRGIDIKATTPLWMQERLRRCGLRSIDPVVDVTNYIMLEMNHPMHAYDLAKLRDGIQVRLAQPEEKLKLLDDSEVTLRDDTLLICDGSGAIGMAGLMGGLTTSVTAETTDILFECAFFQPATIAGKARSYGMNTDAAHRFERGVDWRGQAQAVERATALLLEITGGQAGPVVDTFVAESLPQSQSVMLRHERITRLLGVDIDAGDVEGMLNRLEFTHRKETFAGKAGWLVTAPSHRFDIAIEADLIEEISRIYGYNTLPIRLPNTRLDMAAQAEGETALDRLNSHLVSRGYQEAMTYGFVDAAQNALLDPENEPVSLANPLSSEMSVMRTTLWTGLLKSVAYNLNRQQSRVRLFEIGLRIRQLPNQEKLEFDNIRQEKVLAGAVTGPRHDESWANDSAPVDFFDVKGDLEGLLAASGDGFEFVRSTHPALHPGQAAEIRRAGRTVGHVGRLAPLLERTLDLGQSVFVFELELSAFQQRQLASANPLSRFPEVRRDLAIMVSDAVSAAEVVACVRQNAGEHLTDVTLFDVYAGDGVAVGHKSLALALSFQSNERTLLEEDISAQVANVVAALEQDFAAVQR